MNILGYISKHSLCISLQKSLISGFFNMRAFEQPLTGCLWWGGHSLVCSNDCAQTKQMLIIVSKLHKSQCQQEVWSNPAPLFFPFSLTLEVMLMLDRVRASRAGQMTTLGPSKCIILLDSSFPNWTLHCLDLPECSFIMSVSCVCMCVELRGVVCLSR